MALQQYLDVWMVLKLRKKYLQGCLHGILPQTTETDNSSVY